jgi:hypothetical protein
MTQERCPASDQNRVRHGPEYALMITPRTQLLTIAPEFALKGQRITYRRDAAMVGSFVRCRPTAMLRLLAIAQTN